MKLKQFLWLIGIVILAVLFLKLDLSSMAKIISGISWQYFLLAILTIPFIALLRGYRYQLTIKAVSLSYPLKNSVHDYLLGMGVGALTPGRIGNFIRVPILKKAVKTTTERALVAVFMDNILDILLLSFVGGIGIIILFIKWQVALLSLEWLITGLFLFLLALFSYLFRASLFRRFEHILEKATIIIPQKYRSGLKGRVKELHQMFKEMEKHIAAIAWAFIVNLMNWVFVTLAGFFIARSLGLDITVLFVFAVISISAFVAALPISIFGLGTREATIIAIFSLVEIPAEFGLAFSLLVALITAWSLAFLGALTLLKKS
ncbi:MAG: lysylphosphatidylglycerol synthase transmembrane domain-containing protein [Nanoarchaeota archaeon]